MQAMRAAGEVLRMRPAARARCARCSLAGCGVLDDEGPAVRAPPDPAVYGPAKAAAGVTPPVPVPKLARRRAEVARALDGGRDRRRRPGRRRQHRALGAGDRVRRRAQRLHWSSWGDDGAVGPGRVRCSTCQPTCAGGGSERVPAAITLSGVKTLRRAALLRARRGQIAADGRAPGRPARDLPARALLRRGGPLPRGRARWPHSGHGERAISSPHQRQPHESTDCISSRARPSGSAGQITASTSLLVPQ